MKLRIYSRILELVSWVLPYERKIRRHDRNLAEQLKRAMTSVPLNVAEGYYSRGGNQAAHYHVALGSAGESLACLQVAEARRYIASVEPNVLSRFDEVIGTLAKLSRGR